MKGYTEVVRRTNGRLEPTKYVNRELSENDDFVPTGVRETESRVSYMKKRQMEMIVSGVKERMLTSHSTGCNSEEGEHVAEMCKPKINIPRKRIKVDTDIAKVTTKKLNDQRKEKRTKLKKVVVTRIKRRGNKVPVNEMVSDSETSGYDNMLHASIRTRTSPTPLFVALHSLSTEQKIWLKAMGFGKMLKFNIDRIPGKLGYYVVDHFDDKEMEIKIDEGVIKVTKETIHDMIGVPLGGVKLQSLDDEKSGDSITREWFEQYNKKEISPVEIKEKIVQSDALDWNFKLNFLILFTNILGGCKSRGTCKLGLLAYIGEDTAIENIDWCRYLYECMKSCKTGWKRHDAGNYFAGPITLLTLIYVDATRCEHVNVVRRRPAARSWNFEYLKQREKMEIEDGGFGLRDVLPVLEATTLEETDASDEEHTNIGDIYGSSPPDIKGYVRKMESLYIRIVKGLVHLNSTSMEALTKFPGNEQAVEWQVKVGNVMGKIMNIDEDISEEPKAEEINTSIPCKVNEASKNMIGDSPGLSLHMSLATKASNEEVNIGLNNPIDISVDTEEKSLRTPLPSKTSNAEIPDDELPLSQFWSDPFVIEELEKSFQSINNTSDHNIRYMQDDSIPGFSLGLTQEFENAASEAIELTQNKNTRRARAVRGTRIAKPSAVGRSPFFGRVTELRKQMTKEESNVWKYIKSQSGNHTEILFSTATGHETILDTIETMVPGALVSAHIIDCWAFLLNIDEEKRSKDTVSRLYFHTGMTSEIVLKARMNDEVRLRMFISNVEEVCRGDQNLMTLKDIDLVFFPIIQENHFYLVCFNLKTIVFEVIDNIYDLTPFKKKYKGVPEKLQKVFFDYLKFIGHVKAERILRSKPVRLAMKWRTVKNSQDCGIFAMRHMETYKGAPLSKWDCDMDIEGAKQKGRLNRLRQKYTVKILLSEHNLHKPKVLSCADAYAKST